MTDKADTDEVVAVTKGVTEETTDANEESKKTSKQPVKSVASLHFDRSRDTLGERYDIVVSTPLPHLDSKHAKAYEVRDNKAPKRAMFALICSTQMPARVAEILACSDLQHSCFIRPVACDMVPISSLNASRFVTIHEQPEGQPISQWLKNGYKFTEKTIIKDVIFPACEILTSLQNRKVLHGKISTENLFFRESGNYPVMFGECFSDPLGSAQPFFFEPPDRALAHPYGRGDNDIKADYYALGVVVLHMLVGFNPLGSLTYEEYIEKILAHGSYNTLVGNREFTGMMDDLLKGLLADHPDDRWDNTQLEKWLGGKKFNLLRPAPPREAPRPYLYNDTPFFNRKHLSHHLAKNWQSSRSELRDKKLSRWVELSVKRPDVAEKILSVIQITGGETGRLATDDDDLITKTLVLTDPLAPLRLNNLAIHVSSIGIYYAHAMHEAKANSLNFFQRILDGDYLATWMEANNESHSYSSVETVWQVDKLKAAYRMGSMGFGVERLLYELNPYLICQSPLLLSYGVTNLLEILYAMERLPNDVKRSHEPYDRHIMAYVMAKMKIFVEVHTKVENFPNFKRSNTLRAVLLLAQAQQRINNPPLTDLTRWAAERLKPLTDNLHSRSLRKEILEEMEKAVPRGQLALVARLINNPEVIQQDEEGFRKARHRFAVNAKKISDLNRRGTINERAESAGAKVALVISAVVFVVSLLKLIGEYVRF